MAKTVEEQMISDAIAGTEKEIFTDAVGVDAPDTDAGEEGDRSPEDMGEGLEGQHEDDGAKGGAEDDVEGDEGDDDAEPARDPKTGQFKPKEGEDGDGRTADKAGDKQPGAKAADKPAANDPRIPPGRLREEAEKRRAVEQELDAAVNRATKAEEGMAALNKRLDDLMTAIAGGKSGQQPAQQPAQAKQEDDPKPDIFSDPDGYDAWVNRQIDRRVAAVEQRREVDRVELSMQVAHERNGTAFEEAYKAVTALDPRDPNARQTVQRIWGSPNPGKALVNWYNQQRTLAEVGDDPAAYREKVAQETREALMNDPEFRKQLLEDIRADANGGNGNGQPRHVTRGTTKSLNSARGGGMGQLTDRRSMSNADADVFASAFDDN